MGAAMSDPRDLAIQSLTPTLMAPRFGALDAPETGLHRYILGANGLYIQAHSRALQLCIKVSDTPPLPYGEVREYVRMANGLLPQALYRQMKEKAVNACPKEWAGVVVFDRDTAAYRLVEPEVCSASAGHVTYSMGNFALEDVVLDIHSHATGAAYFSTTDDRSDQQGIYLATVLGECGHPDTISTTTRIVINGQFFPVPWTPWSES